MNKSIAQTSQNDKQISNTIQRFFTRYYMLHAMSYISEITAFKNFLVSCIIASITGSKKCKKSP